MTTEKAVSLFERFGVYTRTELESRTEIAFESYSKAINIEAKTMLDIASKSIVPAVVRYIGSLADTLGKVKSACPAADAGAEEEMLIECSALLTETRNAMKALTRAVEEAGAIKDAKTNANAFCDRVVPAMDALRAPVDKLEMIVDKEYWPMPSYGDLLFEV